MRLIKDSQVVHLREFIWFITSVMMLYALKTINGLELRELFVDGGLPSVRRYCIFILQLDRILLI
jgi:hypothetical protein